MAGDYALLAKLRDLDEAMEEAEHWLEKYRTEAVPELRMAHMRRYVEDRERAISLMWVVADHGREK